MDEMEKDTSSVDEAVDYLKMRLNTSPTRFQLIRGKIAEELKRIGLGEFTEEEVKKILEKVDQK